MDDLLSELVSKAGAMSDEELSSLMRQLEVLKSGREKQQHALPTLWFCFHYEIWQISWHCALQMQRLWKDFYINYWDNVLPFEAECC